MVFYLDTCTFLPGGESMREVSPILRLSNYMLPRNDTNTLCISLPKGSHTATSNFKLVGYFNYLLTIQCNHQILLKPPPHNSREASNYIFLESSFRKQESSRGRYSLEVITSTQVSRYEIHSCFWVRIENNHYPAASWHSGGRFPRNSFKKAVISTLFLINTFFSMSCQGFSSASLNLWWQLLCLFIKTSLCFAALFLPHLKETSISLLLYIQNTYKVESVPDGSIKGPWAHLPCALLVGI